MMTTMTNLFGESGEFMFRFLFQKKIGDSVGASDEL